jgi:hypothetical protein
LALGDNVSLLLLFNTVTVSSGDVGSFTFNIGATSLADRSVDWASDTVKLMLVTPAYVPNKDHASMITPAASEVSVSGYVRQTLTSCTVTSDAPRGRVVYDAADPSPWTLATGDTIQGVVIYKDTGSDATSIPLFYLVLPTAYTTSGVPFGLRFPASGITSVGDEDFMQKTVILTDAQVKDLPVTPITIIPAPGVGRAVLVLGGFMTLDATSGAYTNVDTTSGQNRGPTLAYQTADSTVTFGFSDAAWEFLETSARQSAQFGLGFLGSDSSRLEGAADVTSSFENADLVVGFRNGANGSLTGGNSANTLRVTVIYAIVNL